jgi:hypothetical protein
LRAPPEFASLFDVRYFIINDEILLIINKRFILRPTFDQR